MAMFPPPALSISFGIVIGDTRLGPFLIKRSICSEIVVIPPIPDPMMQPYFGSRSGFCCGSNFENSNA